MNQPPHPENTRPVQRDDLPVRPKVLFWIAVAAAIATFVTTIDHPHPTALGLVSAGFILAYALQRRP